MGRGSADLLIKNVRVFNVYTGELESGDIAVKNGKIVGIGNGYRGEREYDGAGRIALPGLIDSHIHVESSMLSPEEFARLAVAHGTTAIICDPHEIVNVCGVEGAEYLSESFSRLRQSGVQPLDVFMRLPSCVPATPFETSGAVIGGKETETELGREMFHGLGEMMNYPAVLAGEEDCLRKLAAAKEFGKTTDGHAPALTGKELCAYRLGGILTDHEALTAEECREKLARGMYIQLRTGSSANNVEETSRAVTAFNFRRFLVCSDDKNARDLQRGHMNATLAQLVACGVPANQAVCMATSNVAECYGLKDRGALAPDMIADIVLVHDMQSFGVQAVFKRGVLAAEHGRALFEAAHYLPTAVKSTVRIKTVKEEHFKISVGSGKMRAMKITPHGLVTEEEIVEVSGKDDLCLQGTDLNKLAVIERHRASGNIGLGLVKGYGLSGAAIGITVSHDSHNLVILGDDNKKMARVAALLCAAGGGMAYVDGAREEVFPLDIAGLMSSAPAEEVVRRTRELAELARAAGVKEHYEPFMTLAFLSLAVIPKLKLTDKGLVDVTKFAFTSLEVK